MVDKILTEPKHAVSKDDLRLILESVPPGWLDGVSSIRLLNARQSSHSTYIADGILLIYSRGYSKAGTVREILNQLAANSMLVKRVYWKFSKAQMKKLDAVTAPLLETLLPQMVVSTRLKEIIPLEPS